MPFCDSTGWAPWHATCCSLPKAALQALAAVLLHCLQPCRCCCRSSKSSSCTAKLPDCGASQGATYPGLGSPTISTSAIMQPGGCAPCKQVTTPSCGDQINWEHCTTHINWEDCTDGPAASRKSSSNSDSSSTNIIQPAAMVLLALPLRFP